ncbi:hypothetical protein [Nocardia lijiangensis]|uniref:hypothetical protein n=1 Tax=Nocardia lijiangensis TaxID=299618 RepID=UPI003D750558
MIENMRGGGRPRVEQALQTGLDPGTVFPARRGPSTGNQPEQMCAFGIGEAKRTGDGIPHFLGDRADPACSSRT